MDSNSAFTNGPTERRINYLPNVPLFFFDIYFTRPSIRGLAIAVASSVATREDIFDAPTALMEKLYGGAEKTCERVKDIRTNHDMQVVNKSVAQRTAGEASIANG